MANQTTTTSTCECHINTTTLHSQPPSVWRNNPAACLDQCRTQFLGGLLHAWGESSASGKGDGWAQGCGSLNKGVDVREFWTLYWCDATFCGVAIEEGGGLGQDPNVDRIINTCQNIGFYSLLDPGPPPSDFHCPLDSNSSGDCSFTALTAPQTTRGPEIDPGSTAPTTLTTPSQTTTDGVSSSTLTSSSTSTASSATPADTSPPTNNLTAQGKAAIAICSVLALIILITVVLLCLHRQKRRKASLDAGADVPPSRRAREGLLASDPEAGTHPEGGGETVTSGASPTPLISPTTSAVDYGNGNGNGNEKKGILKTTTTATTTATTATNEKKTGTTKKSNPPLRLRDRKFLFPSILRAASSSGNNGNGKSRAYSPPLSPLTSIHSTHSTPSHPPSRSGVAFASGAGGGLSEKDGHGIFPASPICSPTVTKLLPRQERSGSVTAGRPSEAGYADYPPPPPPPPPSVLSSVSALSSPEKKVRLDSPRTNFSLPVPLLKGTKGAANKGEKQGAVQRPQVPSDPEKVPIVGGDPNRASDSASSYYTNGTSTAHSSLRHHEIPIGIPLFAGDAHARSPSPSPSLSPSPLRPPRPHDGPLHVPGLVTPRGRSTGTGGSGSYARNEILLPGDYHPRGRTGGASITSVSSTPTPPPLSPPPTRALPKTPNGGASSPSPPPTREVSVSGGEKGMGGGVPRAFPLLGTSSTTGTIPVQIQIQAGADLEGQAGPAPVQHQHQPEAKPNLDLTPDSKPILNTFSDPNPKPDLNSSSKLPSIPTNNTESIPIPTPVPASPLPQHLGLGSPVPGPSAAVDGPPPPYEYDQGGVRRTHSYSHHSGQPIPRKGGDGENGQPVGGGGRDVTRREDWRGSWGSWSEMRAGVGGGNKAVSAGDDGIGSDGGGYNSLGLGVGEGIGAGQGRFDGEVDTKGPGLAGVLGRGETAG